MRHALGFRDLEWVIKAGDSSAELPDVTVPYGKIVYRISEERIKPEGGEK